MEKILNSKFGAQAFCMVWTNNSPISYLARISVVWALVLIKIGRVAHFHIAYSTESLLKNMWRGSGIMMELTLRPYRYTHLFHSSRQVDLPAKIADCRQFFAIMASDHTGYMYLNILFYKF